jgi:hypothetical protein
MSNRLATRIGLPSAEERPAGALDVVGFHEPPTGALVRTKGSIFLIAQVTGTHPSLGRAAREALESVERDYYYDLSAGVLGALAKALSAANRRLYHQGQRLGIPRRGGVGVIALVVRGREGHVAKLGPASGVILRNGRSYEIPPPPAVDEEDPRVRRRRVAATLGEALEIEPYTWHGDLAPDDRIALVSRNLAQVVGVDELKRALELGRPALAVEHLQRVFAIRGGSGSDGALVIHITELEPTTVTHQLEPVRLAEPLAGVPDQSPVPLADAIGRALHRGAAGLRGARAAIGHGGLILMSWILAFVPRRRPSYPRSIPRTAVREEGRRRRNGLAGMVIVTGLLTIGATVASLPAARPTDAIPRATIAREAILAASAAIGDVERRVDGADLVDRDPEAARELLAEAFDQLGVASGAGVADDELLALRARVDRRLDALYAVTRLSTVSIAANLGAELEDVDATDMVAASDGSLWVLESGRGRVMRVDPSDGGVAVIYRAGQALETGQAPGEPWLIATAATDVVVIDRDHRAWRIDLTERIPRSMPMSGLEHLSPQTTLLGALQHRPPLEIFTLYAVDGATGEVRKWTPPAVIPVTFPDPPEIYLGAAPDLDPRAARDLRVDVNMWLMHSSTVTRVDFGSPRTQEEFSLDPPPDADVRPRLDYRLLDGATLGDRDFLYAFDAANARLIAYQRADGAFVRQWLAPSRGRHAGVLDDVRAVSVASVADGPAVAYLLKPDQVLRVVLE